MGYRGCTYYQLFTSFNETLSEYGVHIIVDRRHLEVCMRGHDFMMTLPLRASVERKFLGISLREKVNDVGIVTVYRETTEEEGVPLLTAQVHDDDIIQIFLHHLPRNLRRRIERAIDEFFEKDDVLVALK
jgi:hypothetical protein